MGRGCCSKCTHDSTVPVRGNFRRRNSDFLRENAHKKGRKHTSHNHAVRYRYALSRSNNYDLLHCKGYFGIKPPNKMNSTGNTGKSLINDTSYSALTLMYCEKNTGSFLGRAVAKLFGSRRLVSWVRLAVFPSHYNTQSVPHHKKSFSKRLQIMPLGHLIRQWSLSKLWIANLLGTNIQKVQVKVRLVIKR